MKKCEKTGNFSAFFAVLRKGEFVVAVCLDKLLESGRMSALPSLAAAR